MKKSKLKQTIIPLINGKATPQQGTKNYLLKKQTYKKQNKSQKNTFASFFLCFTWLEMNSRNGACQLHGGGLN